MDANGMFHWFEFTDLLGFLSVAASVLATAFYLGKRLGKVESAFEFFAGRNHEDHSELRETMIRSEGRFTDHERRIGNLEGHREADRR